MLATLAALSVPAGAACGDDGGADDPSRALERELREAAPAGIIPPGVEVSGYQREVFADGVVEYAEYEEAVLRTVACMRDAGLVVADPAPSAGGRFLEYSYEVVAGSEAELPAATAEADAAYVRCYVEFESLVGEAWLRQTAPSEEELDAALEGLAGCLRDAGVEGLEAGFATPEEMSAAVARIEPTPPVLECFDLFNDATAVPAGTG